MVPTWQHDTAKRLGEGVGFDLPLKIHVKNRSGIVTETGFEALARQGRLPAWISSPTAGIASRRRSTASRYVLANEP
jgi:hypothetical protein